METDPLQFIVECSTLRGASLNLAVLCPQSTVARRAQTRDCGTFSHSNQPFSDKLPMLRHFFFNQSTVQSCFYGGGGGVCRGIEAKTSESQM